MYVQINIGRNIGDTPMSGKRWNSFKGEVSGLLDLATPADSGRIETTGMGVWGADTEETAIIAAICDGWSTGEGGRYNEQWLAIELASVARRYLQDDIGLIVANNSLVSDRL